MRARSVSDRNFNNPEPMSEQTEGEFEVNEVFHVPLFTEHLLDCPPFHQPEAGIYVPEVVTKIVAHKKIEYPTHQHPVKSILALSFATYDHITLIDLLSELPEIPRIVLAARIAEEDELVCAEPECVLVGSGIALPRFPLH